MARVTIVGSGMVGMGLAMLLAADGHDVTCVERDAEPPPADAEAAWDHWDRRGVNQFRLLHTFLAGFHQVVTNELPQVVARLQADGALQDNVLRGVPEFITGGRRDGDERFDVITGRRAMVERSVAVAAEDTPGVTIRRGVAVVGLLTGAAAVPGAIHVTGVRTETGEELPADLVIDAGGRRSALPTWLAAAGSPPIEEEREDSGFIYFGRHFRSADGSVPVALGGALQEYGSISALTLAADHGTWGIGLIGRADDKALRRLSDPVVWERTVRTLPTIAHWLDGKPLEDRVTVMAKIEDRIRTFWPGGRPTATGVLAVGDAWACTNPSVGRGASIGMLHATVLRDTLRVLGDDPAGLAEAFGVATAEKVEPWYRATLAFDRGRLDEMAMLAAGATVADLPAEYETIKALGASMMKDPDCFRAFLDVAMVLNTPAEVMARPGMEEKVAEMGRRWREEPALGPSRSQLVELVSS
jgi:2-polyprenyl-6-methoxyphenol hydroxylase-like FAD-dependent oxidoreductase